jgi:alkanesulfonate monooxygenase SsuD/methylene tetrahydromethanopterin reductase-like flavin-dependent oxidoreductase (luciferase family)
VARYRKVLAAHHPESRGHVTLMLHTFLGHDMDTVRARVTEPLTRYLRSSFDLRMRTPSKRGRVRDTDALGEREIGLVLRRAADRYFRSAGLFGPPERCVEIVDRYADIGIDEIACLIDYGPDIAATMGSLELLARLCDQ